MFLLICMLSSSAVMGVAPNVSLATLPVVYFGGINATRTQANLEMLAKMRVVGIEKWEGRCWSDCLFKGTNCGPECNVEQYMLDTIRNVKALNPAVSTFFYWNTLLDFRWAELVETSVLSINSSPDALDSILSRRASQKLST